MATVKTIEEDFHRHLEILLLIGLTGSNGPPGSSTTPGKLPLVASLGNQRRS
jgi:hypothetical protein